MWKVNATEEYKQWFDSQSGEIRVALLRASTGGHVVRVLYFFDEERQGLLLVGGDKRGKDSAMFYRTLIAEAESLTKRLKG